MGKYNKDEQRDIPQDAQRHKRFCSVCHRVSYDFECCGKRTHRLSLQTMMRDKAISVNSA